MLSNILQLRCDDAEFSNKEKIRLKEKISSLTTEIDHLKQKADNSVEISELQNKNNALEKEISKLKRTVEVNTIEKNFFARIPFFVANLKFKIITGKQYFYRFINK